MKDYQVDEWLHMVTLAEKALESDCPLIEDEVICAANAELTMLWEFVHYIAHDWIESSQDKVRIQRDDYLRKANMLLRLREEEKV